MSDVLPYSLRGAPNGTAVLMIHPLGADRSFWDACRDGLGAGRATVACDLRGAGAAPVPMSPVTPEGSVGDLEALRAALGLERIVLVGCAVGAMVAALYAARHPDRAAALVMANPGIRISEAAGADLVARAARVRRDGMSALLPQAIERAFAGVDEALRRRYEDRFVAQDAEGYAQSVLGVVGADVAPVLGAVRCPMLLAPGGRDALFPPAVHAAEIAMHKPEARIVDFPDGAHFIPYQQPERFAGVVADFLAQEAVR